MNWSNLTVTGAERPPNLGIRTSLPFVEVADGGGFLIRDVTAENPIAADRMEDPSSVFESGEIVSVLRRSAERGFVLLIANRASMDVLRRLGDLPVAFEQGPEQIWSIYAAANNIEEKRLKVAEHLLSRAHATISECTGRSSSRLSRDLEGIEATLRMIRYLTDVGDELRRRMVVLLGVLLRRVAPLRWEALRGLAQTESQLPEDKLNAAIEEEETRLASTRPAVFGSRLSSTGEPAAELAQAAQ